MAVLRIRSQARASKRTCYYTCDMYEASEGISFQLGDLAHDSLHVAFSFEEWVILSLFQFICIHSTLMDLWCTNDYGPKERR